MEAQTSVKSEEAKPPVKKRRPWLPLIWVLVGIIVVGAVGTSLWKLKYGKYRDHEIKYGITVVDKASEHRANANREDYLAHVMVMRSEWKPWAFQHKDLLKKLISSHPNNEAQTVAIYLSLPPVPPTFKDTGTSPVTVSSNTASSNDFSWEPLMGRLNVSSVTDANMLKIVKKIRAASLERVQRNLEQFHDIEISNSVNGGVSRLALWASGRITEDTYVHQRIPGKPVLVEGIPHEIVPSYEFMKGKVK